MQTPYEARMCPIDFEVQRSRSQCINYWKWFPAHNCFPFKPIIMKLHIQTPHEARMCPIDFEVKRSKVKVTMEILISWKIVPAGGICPVRTAPDLVVSVFCCRNIQVNYKRNLIAVDHEKKEAIFENLDSGEKEKFKVLKIWAALFYRK